MSRTNEISTVTPVTTNAVFYAGRTVAQLVEALCHKTQGHGFDYQWGYWKFSSDPVHSVRNGN